MFSFTSSVLFAAPFLRAPAPVADMDAQAIHTQRDEIRRQDNSRVSIQCTCSQFELEQDLLLHFQHREMVRTARIGEVDLKLCKATLGVLLKGVGCSKTSLPEG